MSAADPARLTLRRDGAICVVELDLSETKILLDEDDPRRGAAHAVDDRSFGYRDGHYFPGQGELGARRLRDTDEVRLFYVFHEP